MYNKKNMSINFWVDGKRFNGFLDTGSIISLVSKQRLDKQFHTIKIEWLETFLGAKRLA